MDPSVICFYFILKCCGLTHQVRERTQPLFRRKLNNRPYHLTSPQARIENGDGGAQ
jgi:hypothetical protein